jgi:hypothetical protein
MLVLFSGQSFEKLLAEDDKLSKSFVDRNRATPQFSKEKPFSARQAIIAARDVTPSFPKMRRR